MTQRDERAIAGGVQGLLAGILLAAALGSGCLAPDSRLTPSQSTLGLNLSQQDIVDMTREGLSSDEIIKQIRATGSSYHLTLEEYEHLSQEGVSPIVLKAMKATDTGGSRRKTASSQYGVDL